METLVASKRPFTSYSLHSYATGVKANLSSTWLSFPCEGETIPLWWPLLLHLDLCRGFYAVELGAEHRATIAADIPEDKQDGYFYRWRNHYWRVSLVQHGYLVHYAVLE